MFRRILPSAMMLALAACGQDNAPEQPEAETQRIALEPLAEAPAMALPSPDTSAALWSVSANGQAIAFGDPEGPTLMTLACRLDADPPLMEIIRHAPARPGQKALFPVIGNGMRSRFPVDAMLQDGEWRWVGAVAATDPMLDVFGGPRKLTATLPGGEMLEIAGSPVPGEFLEWCRAGGDVAGALADEADEATDAAPAR